MRVGTMIVSIGLAVLPHLSQAQADCGRPITGEDHWPVAAPEADYRMIEEMGFVVTRDEDGARG